MSKPEPPQKIDPLPTPKSGEPRKTGWEPPTPQKVRSLERRMGIVLAFSLLAAIGFVGYRKFDEKRRQPGDPQKFVTTDKTGDATSSGQAPDSGQTELIASGDVTPIEFEPPERGAARDTDELPTLAHRTAPPMNLVADNEPPAQPDPEFDGFEMQLGPADNGELPDQDLELAGDPGGNPFDSPLATAESTDPPEQTATVVESSEAFEPSFAAIEATDPPEQPDFGPESTDPFGAPAFAEMEQEPDDDQSAFSSDRDSPFGSPAALGQPEFDTEVATLEPALDEPAPSDDNVPQLSPPAMSLFDSEDPPPEQGAELEFSREPAPNPFGAPDNDAAVAESTPPGRLEVNDPQVMPTIPVAPFANTEPDVETAPPSAEPATSNPFLEATAVTEVREAPAADPPIDRGNPFGGGGEMTVRQRTPRAQHEPLTPRAQHDPFTPAHDVSRAVSEDEVVIHVVQTGDNFWKIAREHYGAGKYSTALAAYNQARIPDPKHMRPGMKVIVPTEATLLQQFPQLVSGQPAARYAALPNAARGFSLDPSGRPQYRVAKGDTLSEIAQRHLGRSSRWRQIYGMNKDQLANADSLTTGMVLRLPADATEVRMDDGRVRSR